MRRLLAILLGTLLVTSLLAQPERKMKKKKKDEDKEPVTQVLAALPDPPAAISADTARLTFQVAPLSAKGLLSQQSRDALKALMQSNRGGTIVRLRAFVAGTGDMRRVQSIVSETFAEKKMPLPVLSTVQVGTLPLVGAQVAMEAISVDKKVVNPEGLVFFSGLRASDMNGAVGMLKSAAAPAGVSPNGMLSITCYASSLDAEAARTALSATFPMATLNVMEAQRLPPDQFATCEAVGRVEANLPGSSNEKAAVIKTSKVVFSGIQMAFGPQDADLRLAFERLRRGLGSLSAPASVVAVRFYTLDRSVAPKLSPLATEFFKKNSARAILEIEGLPSLDASMAMDVIAEAN